MWPCLAVSTATPTYDGVEQKDIETGEKQVGSQTKTAEPIAEKDQERQRERDNEILP